MGIYRLDRICFKYIVECFPYLGMWGITSKLNREIYLDCKCILHFPNEFASQNKPYHLNVTYSLTLTSWHYVKFLMCWLIRTRKQAL